MRLLISSPYTAFRRPDIPPLWPQRTLPILNLDQHHNYMKRRQARQAFENFTGCKLDLDHSFLVGRDCWGIGIASRLEVVLLINCNKYRTFYIAAYSDNNYDSSRLVIYLPDCNYIFQITCGIMQRVENGRSRSTRKYSAWTRAFVGLKESKRKFTLVHDVLDSVQKISRATQLMNVALAWRKPTTFRVPISHWNDQSKRRETSSHSEWTRTTDGQKINGNQRFCPAWRQ